MKKEALLTTAVIALLVLNAGILAFLFWGRPGHPPGMGPGKLDKQIIRQLQLTDVQQQQFDVLKRDHRKQMNASDSTYRKTMGQYFDLLKMDAIPTAQRDSLEAVLSKIQTTRAQVTLDHFSALKSICTPAQKPLFDSLLPELLQVIVPPPKPRK